MIQVIDRTVALLEAIGAAGTLELREAATRTGLTPSTCSHILTTLKAHNWVDQALPKGPYRLGPALHRLTRSHEYRAELVRAAGAPLAHLTRTSRETSSLVAISNGRRIVLRSMTSDQPVQVKSELAYQERFYSAATGRLLLAHADEAARDEILAIHGPPTDAEWKSFRDAGELAAELERIRRLDHIVISEDNREIAAVAAPVRSGGRVTAAVGVFLPAYRMTTEAEQELVTAVLKCSRAIELALGSEANE